MKTAMETAIKALAMKASGAEKASDAQQYAQAALNLAHVFATFDHAEKKKE